jgi:hypothetical protein
MIPPSTDPTRNRPAAPVELRNVRPIARPAPRPPAAVHPVLAEIARTRPGYTDARIDGRPVRIYIERPRWRVSVPWVKVAALVAAIVTPLLAVAYLVAVALAWCVDHWYLFAAALALVVLAPTLGRAGVCCPGLHCPGCGHR